MSRRGIIGAINPSTLFTMKKYIIACALALLVAAPSAFAGTSPVSGWAWSSGIGWISFNSSNAGAGSGAAYSVKVSTTTGSSLGYFSQGESYGWSPNVGWISFKAADVAGCPSGSCEAVVNSATGQVSGWARVLSMTGLYGGGYIELAGTGHVSPDTGTVSISGKSYKKGGVTYDSTTGTFGGFGWEPDALGWLSFDASAVLNGTGGVALCLNPGTCSPAPAVSSMSLLLQRSGDTAPATQNLSVTADASGNVTVNVYWNPQNVSNVRTASSDWPEIMNSPTSSAGGSFSTPGSETIILNNGNSSTNVIKNLVLSYDEGIDRKYIAATVTMYPYSGAGAPACVQPKNSIACGTVDSGTPGPAVIHNSCAPTPISCEFICNISAGYRLSGGSCVKSSIIER